MGKKGAVKDTWRSLRGRGGRSSTSKPGCFVGVVLWPLATPFQSQLTDTAFLAGGLDRADWRKRKYLPPSVDEAQDDHEASLFDEGQVSRSGHASCHTPKHTSPCVVPGLFLSSHIE